MLDWASSGKNSRRPANFFSCPSGPVGVRFWQKQSAAILDQAVRLILGRFFKPCGAFQSRNDDLWVVHSTAYRKDPS